MRTLEHFIGGKSVAGTSGLLGPIYDPARGIQTASVPLASEAEVDAAVEVATEAAADWGAGSFSSRAAVLFRFRDLVAQAAPDLAAAVTAEHGKVLSDAAGEVARGLENIEFACGLPHLLKGSMSTRGLDGGRRAQCARTPRCGGGDHAVQLPGDGAAVDDGQRARLWQCVHPQTIREGPLALASPGRAGSRGRVARRRAQRGSW